MSLAEVRHARHFSETLASAVEVTPDGRLVFYGQDGLAACDAASDRSGLAESIREDQESHAAEARFWNEDGSSRVPLAVFAPRTAPWTTVREVLGVGLEAMPPMHDLRLGVHRADPLARTQFFEGQVHALNLEVEAGPVTVEIGSRILRDKMEIHISLPERTFVVRNAARALDDATLVRDANRVWDAAAGHLATHWSEHTLVRLVVRAPELEITAIPWAYVTKVIDLLLGVGVREFHFVNEGLRFVVGEPEPQVDRVPWPDEPFFSVRLLVGCVLAVLLAFALTWPRRGRRRRRRPVDSA